MSFTEYKLSRTYVQKRLAIYQENLLKLKGRTDLADHGSEIMMERLREDPRRYLDYGPYWWALKDVLARRAGLPCLHRNDELARGYSGETDEETIVMAEEFRRYYLDRFPPYTDELVLDAYSDSPWRLYDPDMADAIAAPDETDTDE